ncbi:hypothetical protein AB0O22_18005 [Streptomyces sp. NPDC091204]|uniref:hypothetical protein n=1 Tax=Streptomyces sp. NPDC091204 TaxID=3155299 RepID=UPI00342EA2F4
MPLPLPPRGSRSPGSALAAAAAGGYLAVGDYWFDDEQADSHDGVNSRLHIG